MNSAISISPEPRPSYGFTLPILTSSLRSDRLSAAFTSTERTSFILTLGLTFQIIKDDRSRLDVPVNPEPETAERRRPRKAVRAKKRGYPLRFRGGGRASLDGSDGGQTS